MLYWISRISTFERGEDLKETYIQNGLTLGYTAQTLNLFSSHSFTNMGLIYGFFFWVLSEYSK